MSKILPATASDLSVVTCEGVPIPSAEILSLGKQASSGLLLIDGDKAWYFPSSATDIKTTIEKIIATLDSIGPALTEISTALTAIGVNMTGPTTVTPPTLAASVATIVTKVGEITATKALLNTLKDGLK